MADRAQVEEVGLLLPADGGVHPRSRCSRSTGWRSPRSGPTPSSIAPGAQPNNAPFWTLHPTLEHFKDLLQDHASRRGCGTRCCIAIVSTADLAVLRHARRLRAGAAQVPRLGVPRHRDLRHLPGAADAALHPARRHHPRPAARQHAVGADPHLSDLPDPVLHLAADGLLQDHPEGARGVRAHRRRHALRRHGAHHLPDRHARASCRPASSPSRCPGTSSSTRWSSCPRPSRRPSRSAWSPS